MNSCINPLMDETIKNDLFFAYQRHNQVLLFWGRA